MSNSPFVVAITGTIGSGKSAAAEILRRLGAAIIDADILAREVVAPGSAGLATIGSTFGPGVILPSGELNRKALGKIVFADRDKLAALEDILHPLIHERFLSRLNEFAQGPSQASNIVAYVVPLFYESRYSYPEVSKVIVVSAAREVCIERIVARDNCTREMALRKLDSQMPIAEKEVRADYVIKNEGSLSQLEDRVREVYDQICRDPARSITPTTGTAKSSDLRPARPIER